MPVYCSCACWVSSRSWKGPMKQGLFILPSCCCLLGCFLGIGSLGFSEFWHGTRKPYQVVPPRFFEKTVFAPKSWEKGQSGLWTPKLTVSQERTEVTN